MKKFLLNFDWLLFFALLVLLILGLFTIASVSPNLFPQQAVYAFFGLVLFFLLSLFDYRVFEKIALLLFLGSCLFLATTFLFGTITRGALRWIQIGGLTLQPSELVKPFLILSFAWFFARQKELETKELIISVFLLILPVLLIFLQPDLGSSLMVILSWLGIALAAGISWRFLVLGVLFIIISFPLIWGFLKEYQRQRIFSFFNPLNDPLGAGYNLIQAEVAVGAGQLFGRGFGRGTQSHLRFLPERQTDFIFASFAEELGLLGGMILILGFSILLWRILTIAKETKDPFGYLICLGVFLMIFFQIFVNMGMNLGLLPITGITLPLISYGGSSLVSTMISLGLVESIARLTRKKGSIEIK